MGRPREMSDKRLGYSEFRRLKMNENNINAVNNIQEKFCPYIKGPCLLTDCVACEMTDLAYGVGGLITRIRTNWFCTALDVTIKTKIDDVRT